MSQIPVYNVNNACSTGSTALYMSRQFIQYGMSDCVLAVGWEKMQPGSLTPKWTDRARPNGKAWEVLENTRGKTAAPMNAQIFGNAGKEYMEKYGAKAEHFAQIAAINHCHSALNPYSQFKDKYTTEDVMNSPKIHDYLTKLQCCPTSDGSGAAILVSEKFLNEHPHLRQQAVRIVGQEMATDAPILYSGSAIELVGAEMTRTAAKRVFQKANITPDDIQVCELHDCFSANEMVCLDALGLAKPGKAHELIANGDITYGGKYVVNPSGGLISKGHPLGATGLAQCAELVWQLRGWCGERQVPRVKYALQHNVGLGGAVVITLYQRADGKESPLSAPVGVEDGRKWAGYNPAVEARWLTEEQINQVRSKKARSEFIMGGRKNPIDARL